MSCIFCSIVDNIIPADRVYEDEYVLAFKDMNPVALFHIIIIPKQCCQHFHNIEDNTLAHLLRAIKIIIQDNNFDNQGYRIVNNNGQHGGQTVNHVHFHIIAGEQLGHNLAGH